MKDVLSKNSSAISDEKRVFRLLLTEKRKALTPERRALAQKKLLALLPLLQGYPFILSFFSFGTEIEMRKINQTLAREGRLCLPKMELGHLHLHRVLDLDHDLMAHPSGLKEPIPDRCPLIAINELSFALIPALGFDSNHYRLGYGKGYYDRLLKDERRLPTCGIGFEEQLVEKLPHTEEDMRLSSLFLV